MKKLTHIQVESQGDKLAFVFYKHAVSSCHGLYRSNMLAHMVRVWDQNRPVQMLLWGPAVDLVLATVLDSRGTSLSSPLPQEQLVSVYFQAVAKHR